MPTGLFSCPPLVGDDPAGILRWVSSATVGPTHDGFSVMPYSFRRAQRSGVVLLR